MLKGMAPNIILFDISDSLSVSIDAIGPVGTLFYKLIFDRVN
jgi:hypothetical protein